MNCTEVWRFQSRGFYTGIDPLKFTFPVLMLQVIAIFIISRSLHFLLRPIKQPTYICNIMAGFILGPSLLGQSDKFNNTLFPDRELPILYTISRVGVTLYLFLMSVKLDLTLILNTSRKKVFSIGITGLCIPLAINVCVYIIFIRFVDHNLVNSKEELLNVFSLLSETAFPHVAHLLDELNLLTSELGILAMSCALVNDAIRMLIVLAMIVSREVLTVGWYWTIVTSFITIIFVNYILRPIPIWIIKTTPEGKPVEEKYVAGFLIGALILGGLSHRYFGTVYVGTVLLGMTIPTGSQLGFAIVQHAQLITMELFLPLIFVVFGLNINIFSIKNWKLFGIYLTFVVVSFIGKFVGTLIPAMYVNKMSFRNSLSLGFMMNVKGVLEAMAFHRWKLGKRMNEQNYTTLLLCTTVLTAMMSPLIAVSHKPGERINTASSKHFVKTIQNANKSIGEFRVLLCIHDEDTVGNIISLLEASNSTTTCPITMFVVHLTELIGLDAPILVPYHKQRLTWKSSKSNQIMRAFTKYSKYVDGKITIHPFTLVAPVKTMHECVHRFAQDKAAPLIIVPINKFGRGIDLHLSGSAKSSLDVFGISVQENAPCTVGILVNMGVNDPLRYTRFSYHAAVIFIGGADDREALAYGIRMSGHPMVSITVIRIFIQQGNKTIDKVEKRSDDYLIDEYKEINSSNGCAMYSEEFAEDFVHAISIIKSLRGNYDLVMVGRRRCTDKSIDDEMACWSENPELGLIGDVLVTSESIRGRVSVLIMQQFDEGIMS